MSLSRVKIRESVAPEERTFLNRFLAGLSPVFPHKTGLKRKLSISSDLT